MNATQTLFDAWAESGRGDKMAEGHWPRVSEFYSDMNIEPGMTCLDVGCGNGYAVRKMASDVTQSGKAIGIDISAQMIALAKSQSKTVLNAEFLQSKGEALSLESDSVDRLLSVEMLYYADKPKDVLGEWHRVLKPGGSVWIMVDYYQEHHYSKCWGDLLEVPVHYYSEQEYARLLQTVGFNGISTRRLFDKTPVNPDTFTPGWGYNSLEEVKDFRENIGSLLITGTKE